MKGKRVISCFLAIALATTTVFSANMISDRKAVKAADIYSESATYCFYNAATRNSFDIPNGTDANNVKLQGWGKNDARAQSFQLKDAGEGYYYIIPQCATSRAIDNPNGSWDDGVQYQIYTQNYLDPQKFKFESVGDGKYRIINKASGKALREDDDKAIRQYAAADDERQYWLIKKVQDEYSFTNPTNCDGADPWVIKAGDYYYLCRSAGDGVSLDRAKNLEDLNNSAESKKIFTIPGNDGATGGVWAPEIMYLSGHWYIYYAPETNNGGNDSHRMYVAEGGTNPEDPWDGTYVSKGRLTSTDSDKWAIDGTAFEYNGKLYFVWSGWEGDSNGEQVIYIAEMSNPYTISSNRVMISRPDHDWETQYWPTVNEGPEVLIKDNKVHIVYSASGSWTDDYCLGLLTCTDGNFLNAASWTKKSQPIFQKTDSVFGVGHCSFVKSKDDTEDWIVYHAAKYSGAGWARDVRIQRFVWKDGFPYFGEPVNFNVSLAKPSSDSTEYVSSEKYYKLRNIGTGRCLDIPNGSSGNGVTIQTWIENEADAQQFKFIKSNEFGWYFMEPKCAPGKAVDNPSGRTDKNSNYQIWEQNSCDAQKMMLEKLGENKYRIINKSSLLALTDVSASGGTVEQRILTDDSNQMWELIEIEELTTEQKIENALSAIEIHNADNIRDSITLPSEINGISLTWASSDESVITSKEQKNENYYAMPAGFVTRQKNDRQIMLTVSATLGSVTRTKSFVVTVKAKVEEEALTGYLYAHFNETAEKGGQQQVFFGLSRDGLNWTALNNNNPVLESTESDCATRDPFILKSPNGDKFYLIATDQDIYKYGDVDWGRLTKEGSTALVVWESTDLVNWTDFRVVDVASSIGAGNVWAPEAVYDAATGEYLVYWASNIEADGYSGNHTFVCKTRDFYTFTEPQLFNGYDYATIDTSIYQKDSEYYRLTKNEGEAYVFLQKASNHPLAYGNQVQTKTIGNRTFENVGEIYEYVANTAEGCMETFTGYYEGASMFKFNDRDQWCVMLDEYGGDARGYIPFVTDDPAVENSIQFLEEGEYIIQEGGKHGVILPVTEEQYQALEAKWGIPQKDYHSTEKTGAMISYDFESLDGNLLPDKSGNDFNATVFGSAEMKYDSDQQSNVLYFDGEDDYIELPTGFFDGLENATISMDIKPETTAADHQDFVIGQNTDRYIYLRLRDDLITSGITTRSWQGEYNLENSDSGRLNQWVNVKIVMENHKMSLYIDNILAASNPSVRSIEELGANLICYFGRGFYSADPYFKGSIDNLQIYNRALSEAEITANNIVTQKIEAEEAGLSKPAAVAANNAASGGKKVGWIDNEKAKVTFTLNAPADGTYRVHIASGSGTEQVNASAKYYVNGDETNAKIVKYEAKGWDIWTEYPVEVNLKKGYNTFTVTHSGLDNSFSELDYIVFYRDNPQMKEIKVGETQIDIHLLDREYEVVVPNINTIPEIQAQLDERYQEDYEVIVNPPGKGETSAVLKVISKIYPDFNDTYTINFTGENMDEVKVEINGFQISRKVEGYRTIYSVSDPAEDVVRVGIIYGLYGYASEEEMEVRSANKYVYNYDATIAGKMEQTFSSLSYSQSYTMTMKFGTCSTSFYQAKTMVRAYAELKDGTYVYSDVENCSVYDIADYLYQNIKMNSFENHNYLYTEVLKAVNPLYEEVDYNWGNTLVKPGK